MLETDERGQEMLDELAAAIDTYRWSDWERGFLESVQERDYRALSGKQRLVVINLYDKLVS